MDPQTFWQVLGVLERLLWHRDLWLLLLLRLGCAPRSASCILVHAEAVKRTEFFEARGQPFLHLQLKHPAQPPRRIDGPWNPLEPVGYSQSALIRVFLAFGDRNFVRSRRNFDLYMKTNHLSIGTTMIRPKPPHFPLDP